MAMYARSIHRARHRPLFQSNPAVRRTLELHQPRTFPRLLLPPRSLLHRHRLHPRIGRLPRRLRRRLRLRLGRLVREKDARNGPTGRPGPAPQLKHVCLLWRHHPMVQFLPDGTHAVDHTGQVDRLANAHPLLPPHPHRPGHETLHPGHQDLPRSALLRALRPHGRRRVVSRHRSPRHAGKRHVGTRRSSAREERP